MPISVRSSPIIFPEDGLEFTSTPQNCNDVSNNCDDATLIMVEGSSSNSLNGTAVSAVYDKSDSNDVISAQTCVSSEAPFRYVSK